MRWGVIVTWRMAHDGLIKASELLKKNNNSGDAVESLIIEVENYPYYKSVGYGGLPNYEGIVEMDAAFMNGDNFRLGAIAGVKDIKNPISLARKLSYENFNNFLVGEGAVKYAISNGFEMKAMLTERAKQIWENRLNEIKDKNLSPYDGHDTVGAISLDLCGSMSAATSTSGLFMKHPGRIGDSALSGSGFYVDSNVGGACATGLGEDLMKGCLSYEIVRLMEDGLSPQSACDQAVYKFHHKLISRYGKAGAMSLIAMNKYGEWGVATNVEFTFCVSNYQLSPTIYIANMKDDFSTEINIISQEWLDNYEKRIKAPIVPYEK